jgi:simple sugar transport system ATP-binding protein
MALALRMSGISKHFGPVQALDTVDLEVKQGTIHAVIGENGAGKTTLMRVLYGAERPDSGFIETMPRGTGESGNLERREFQRPSDAIAAGIGMVSQHYGVIPGLTCLENLMLGAEPGAWLSHREIKRRAHELAGRLSFSFNWDADAATLSPAGCQKLELLKLLWKEASVMILDEPTAMLSPVDTDALFVDLRHLADNGTTVILVTHRLPDVLEQCRAVTVLRGGKVVAAREVATTNAEELATLIVGEKVAEAPRRKTSPGEPILEMTGVDVLDGESRTVLKSVELQLHAGEIVGVAGVDGSGQRELVRAILGLTHIRGAVRFLGAPLDDASTSERLLGGMRVIPEDRQSEGLIEDWSLEDNAALGLQRQASLRSGNSINPRTRTGLASEVATRFGTRFGDIHDPASNLSGGNQQRFVAGRALALRPKLILAFQPARGLDILATQAVYEGIREVCANGAAALVISFDLDDLLDNCDRIVTLFGGALLIPSAGHELDRDVIGRQMVGAT